MKNNYLSLENILKIKFKNKKLLVQSLTHKSHSKENNEKLEFLGDRVLGLIVSQELIKKYPNETEGIIDKKLSNLVNKKTCTLIANNLNLKKYMYIGESYKGLKRSDDKILSDCLEALIGAIYLDSGFRNAQKFILYNWKNFIENSILTLIDPKTRLQEYSLKKYKKLPKYDLQKHSGPQHNPVFKAEVFIEDSDKYTAVGSSKKNAQQKAAEKLLNALKII